MSKKVIWGLGLTIIVALSAYGFINFNQPTKQPPHHTLSPAMLPLASQPKGGDFSLMSAKGPVALSDFKGKWVYLYFGYTFCPDICPTNLAMLSSAYHRLKDEEKSQLQFLLISVDPERDTPERLAKYTHYFDMNLLGITGDHDELKKISRNYGAVYRSLKQGDDDKYYAVDHSAFTYVIDPEGNLVGQLPHGANAQMFIKNIRRNLGSRNLGK